MAWLTSNNPDTNPVVPSHASAAGSRCSSSRASRALAPIPSYRLITATDATTSKRLKWNGRVSSHGGCHDNADQRPKTKWRSPQHSGSNNGSIHSPDRDHTTRVALRVLTRAKSKRSSSARVTPLVNISRRLQASPLHHPGLPLLRMKAATDRRRATSRCCPLPAYGTNGTIPKAVSRWDLHGPPMC